ncbi:hypothetical protein HanIR_Chr13g0666561 [Helianthus annuus]|nr:hypothetical protein HanIR_Chr13g0666561 [Helianthus annuus]
MTYGIGLKIKLKINPMSIFIQLFKTINHRILHITVRKLRPSSILLKAITEMPSQPRPLFLTR